MPRFWTAYWQNIRWRDDVNAEYDPVHASGSNLFSIRGVAAGDTVYVVSCADGQLLLDGKMTVKRLVSRSEAVEIWDNDGLYDASEWVVDEALEGTPLQLHRQLSPSVSRQLRFESKIGPKGLFFVTENELDRQAIRGVRELTCESAALFDRAITMTDSMPRVGQMITVTEELLRAASPTSDANFFQLPEELREEGTYCEGKARRVLVNRYERDSAARDKCIEHYGAECFICGFNFSTAYGPAAEGFIHVHHLKPISELKGEYVVDPIVDLRPVCPNCHAMIHLGGHVRSIDEVRLLLRKTR